MRQQNEFMIIGIWCLLFVGIKDRHEEQDTCNKEIK